MAPTLDHLLKKWFKVLWSIFEISLLNLCQVDGYGLWVMGYLNFEVIKTHIHTHIYIYSLERGGLVVEICEWALRSLVRAWTSTWEECGYLCWGASDYQLSRGARVRFVVISNHSDYGSIQYSLAWGIFMVTPRGVSHNGCPCLPLFIQQYIYIYSQTLEKIQLDFNWILNFASRILFNFKFCVK